MSINVYIIKKHVIVQNEENKADEKRRPISENIKHNNRSRRNEGQWRNKLTQFRRPGREKDEEQSKRQMSAAQENRMQASKGGGARE